MDPGGPGDAAVRYRTGNRNRRNIYLVRADGSEEHVGVMFTEAAGVAAVECMNACIALSTYLAPDSDAVNRP